MFDDPNQELERLERQLREEEAEEWLDRELAEARRLLDEDAPECAAANTDRVDVDLESYSDALEQPDAPKEKGIRGLVILACLETAAIVAVILYWVVHFL